MCLCSKPDDNEKTLLKLHHLRNATCVIQSGDLNFLIDPMLSEKGALPPYAWLKHKARRNPLVPLPGNAGDSLNRVTHCLLTHSQAFGIKKMQHTDHLDTGGETFLRKKEIPVITGINDVKFLRKQGLTVGAGMQHWETKSIDGVNITAVPAQHGHGRIQCLMANGIGFFIQLPDEPSLYISGDTVFTDDVERALTELKPDISIVAAGSASLDTGGPILMPFEEIVRFIKAAPGRVVANHLESLNHCPTTRYELRERLKKEELSSKVFIPEDGEILSLDIE